MKRTSFSIDDLPLFSFKYYLLPFFGGGGEGGVCFLVYINSVEKSVWLLLNKILCPIAWRLYSLFHVLMVLVVFPCCVQLAYVSYILNRESSRLQRHTVVQLTDHSCVLYVCTYIYVYLFCVWRFIVNIFFSDCSISGCWACVNGSLPVHLSAWQRIFSHTWCSVGGLKKWRQLIFFTNFSRGSAVRYNVFLFCNDN